jgi:hypothetical protein
MKKVAAIKKIMQKDIDAAGGDVLHSVVAVSGFSVFLASDECVGIHKEVSRLPRGG